MCSNFALRRPWSHLTRQAKAHDDVRDNDQREMRRGESGGAVEDHTRPAPPPAASPSRMARDGGRVLTTLYTLYTFVAKASLPRPNRCRQPPTDTEPRSLSFSSEGEEGCRRRFAVTPYRASTETKPHPPRRSLIHKMVRPGRTRNRMTDGRPSRRHARQRAGRLHWALARTLGRLAAVP